MRNYHFSTLLGLTTTFAVSAPLTAQAATINYNYDPLQFITERPIASNNILNFYGDPSQNQGFTPFYNLDPSAPDHGHREIGLNSRRDAPINNAPYYGTGRQGSPEEPPSDATRMASLTGSIGFPTFSSYLTNNGISLSDIGFAFGQKSDRNFNQTWNLGSDTFGVDWVADPNSPVEQRIYRANPDDVQIGLYNGTDKIVDFGYSDFYSVLDYGLTASANDDFEGNFINPVKATKVSGLNSLENGLADAFLQDVTASGGGVQFVNEVLGIQDVDFATGNGYGIFRIPFAVEVRAVPIKAVPEPSLAWGSLMFVTLMAISHLKKQQNKCRS
ncbi:MAG: hypothetical protein DSM106950_41650 [Stigonema ocellatum SAG 48.90 = DSM 106950]|nr:hypothetical protein [Stigonema ocellatum SAG 48.90 = DSM 106950]